MAFCRREQRGIDLVRIQVHLRVEQGASHPVHGIRGAPEGELVREVRELVGTVLHELQAYVIRLRRRLAAKITRLRTPEFRTRRSAPEACS